MTRKRKRNSEPSETAPDATSTAQPAQVNESGSGSGAAPLEEIGLVEADVDLEVTDGQNNAHGTPSAAAKKRSKTGKKNTQGRGPLAPKPKIVKLKPARPYPTVPTSSSATVPKSRRAEGRNKICVTRRTELGSYLHQCQNVLTKDGYKTLHLSAMGAAIPHAAMLATSLVRILPYPKGEVTTSIKTGTVNVLDEVIPMYEDEEPETRGRSKSSIEIVITTGKRSDPIVVGEASTD